MFSPGPDQSAESVIEKQMSLFCSSMQAPLPTANYLVSTLKPPLIRGMSCLGVKRNCVVDRQLNVEIDRFLGGRINSGNEAAIYYGCNL